MKSDFLGTNKMNLALNNCVLYAVPTEIFGDYKLSIFYHKDSEKIDKNTLFNIAYFEDNEAILEDLNDNFYYCNFEIMLHFRSVSKYRFESDCLIFQLATDLN